MPTKTIVPTKTLSRRRSKPANAASHRHCKRARAAFALPTPSCKSSKCRRASARSSNSRPAPDFGVRMSANGIFFIVQLPLPNGRPLPGHARRLRQAHHRGRTQGRASARRRHRPGRRPETEASRGEGGRESGNRGGRDQKIHCPRVGRTMAARLAVDQEARLCLARLSQRRADVRAFLNIPAVALTRADVKKAIEAKRTKKTKKSGRSRVEGGPGAVRNAVTSLCAAYNWALERSSSTRIRSTDSSCRRRAPIVSGCFRPTRRGASTPSPAPCPIPPGNSSSC